MYLLGGADGDDILLPVQWAGREPRLRSILAMFEDVFQDIGTGGCWWMCRGGSGT
jgi:hypothetical protein